MKSARILALAVLLGTRSTSGAEPVEAQPADFKLVIGRYGVSQGAARHSRTGRS